MRYGILSLLLCLADLTQAPSAGAQSPAGTSAIPVTILFDGTNNADLNLAVFTANKNYKCHIMARTEKNGVEVGRYEMDMQCHGRDMLLNFTKPHSMVENRVMKKGSTLWLFSRNQQTRPILLSPSQFGDKLRIGPLFDILVVDWQNYSPTRLPPQVINGKPCFVVEFKALNQSVFMDAITVWIDQKTRHRVKTDFYDEDRKTLYHSVQEDMAMSKNIDQALRPRRFTVTTDGGDTRYIYEATDFQYNSDNINWDDLFFNQ